MPDYNCFVSVSLDATCNAFLAYTLSEEAHERLREVIAKLTEERKLTKADYDIGANGGLAFKLGSWHDESPYEEVENLGDVCSLLEGALSKALAEYPEAA